MYQLLTVLQRCLPKEDCDWLMQHVVEGAHGYQQFLNSESIKPVIELVYQEYRSFLKGETK